MIISHNVISRPGGENATTIPRLIVSGIRWGANIPVARRAITRSGLFIICWIYYYYFSLLYYDYILPLLLLFCFGSVLITEATTHTSPIIRISVRIGLTLYPIQTKDAILMVVSTIRSVVIVSLFILLFI
jgi:hypothetical protein